MTNTTRRRGRRLGLALAVFAGQASAVELSLPAGAEQSFGTVQSPGAYALPTGPWADGDVPVKRVEGRVEVTAWHIPGAAETSFQLARPFREALVDAGYRILLDCKARACGGFDFRFATIVLPAPEMFVDLTSYHFISAHSESEGAVSILTSRDRQQGYIQIIRAGGGTGDAPLAGAEPRRAFPSPDVEGDADDVATVLEAQGHVILRDLDFGSGSTNLGSGRIASLDALASYLDANPNRRILFVGHTDATGSLEANQDVSLARAQAAVAYLRERHGIAGDRISGAGAGYLAPVATNLTPDGREANRRVEAVLIPTE